jgi:hypothetical protein
MIRKFRETDLDSIMKLWLETNISAHDFIDEKKLSRGTVPSLKKVGESKNRPLTFKSLLF